MCDALISSTKLFNNLLPDYSMNCPHLAALVTAVVAVINLTDNIN